MLEKGEERKLKKYKKNKNSKNQQTVTKKSLGFLQLNRIKSLSKKSTMARCKVIIDQNNYSINYLTNMSKIAIPTATIIATIVNKTVEMSTATVDFPMLTLCTIIPLTMLRYNE